MMFYGTVLSRRKHRVAKISITNCSKVDLGRLILNGETHAGEEEGRAESKPSYVPTYRNFVRL